MTETGLRVLYVDDDPGLSRLVQKGLERRGYTVETAANGAAGVDRVRQGGIDVVALDHYMPGADGLEVLGELRTLPNPPPVIYVTGTQESSVAVAALKAGAAEYVVKSIGEEFIPLLAASVESALATARLRRAKEDAEAETRAARDRFEALAAERAILMREVNHRVGNSLQIIAALLHLQSSASQSEDIRTALGDATRRVMAVAQVHRRLYTSDDVQSVSLDLYLKSLVDDLRNSADSGGDPNLLSLEAEPVELDPDKAVAVGVVVTELVLNATKYAYPGGKGPIRVKLHGEPDGRVRLAVEDDGVGRAGETAPPRSNQGLGRMIVKAMATKLNAEWGEDGSHAGMRVTLLFDPQPSHRPAA